MAHAPHHSPLAHLRARPDLATTQAAVTEQGPQRPRRRRSTLAQSTFTAFAPLGVVLGLSQARRLLGLSFGIGIGQLMRGLLCFCPLSCGLRGSQHLSLLVCLGIVVNRRLHRLRRLRCRRWGWL